MRIKGQFSTIKIGALVIVVTFVALLLFQNQTNTSTQTAETVTSEITVVNTELQLLSLQNTDYVIDGYSNMDISEALIYGCMYGSEEEVEGEFSFMASETEPVMIFPRLYTERHLDRTLGTNYRLETRCSNADGERTLVVGEEVPEDTEVTVKSLEMPLPNGNTTSIRLYRWY